METASYQLPHWVEWAKALGLPALALAVSVLSISVSRWHVRIAREKLKHDLFEKRYEMYEIYNELIFKSITARSNEPRPYIFDQANKNLNKCIFLFDKETSIYVTKFLSDLYKIYYDNNARPPGSNEKLYSDLNDRFLPFLQVSDFQAKPRKGVVAALVGKFRSILSRKAA